MSYYIGLDLGSTSITGLFLDTHSGQVTISETVENKTCVNSPDDLARGRSEWDIERMVGLCLDILSTVVAKCGAVSVAGLGVTGQMHGMVLLDAAGQPIRPFIGWQDRRCEEQMSGGGSFLEEMVALSGEGFDRSGCIPATGYMGSTLFWLAQSDLLPPGSVACFAPDYLVSRLCGTKPITDPTNAASAGVFDVLKSCWNSELISSLGLGEEHFAEVYPSCGIAGKASAAVSQATGLTGGLPVAIACGDNQASFAASVTDCAESLLINIGTGGQISTFVAEPIWCNGLDLRPFLDPGFLLVGAGLCGGRAYRALRDFMQLVGTELFQVVQMPDLYERLNQLATGVPPGAEGLRCEPLFAGSRQEPQRRAVWSGMSETNFTPGHLARALLEGLAAHFNRQYEQMKQAGVADRTVLVGSGNGVRKNPLLREILSASFELPLQMVSYSEEAAVGAALCAAVASGEFASIQEASRAVVARSEANR